MKLKRERGMYVLTTNEGDTISVARRGYVFQLAQRLTRAQGIKSRSITKAVSNALAR